MRDPMLAWTPDPAASRVAIEALLEDWHQAAAESREKAYFSHLASDAIFMGTDRSERWDKAAFQAYAHPHFEAGRGWEMYADRRAIMVDAGGRWAYFDEDLVSATLGQVRGSGVLRLEADGRWRIIHYNLSVTVPNEQLEDLRDTLQPPPPEPDSAPMTESLPEGASAQEDLSQGTLSPQALSPQALSPQASMPEVPPPQAPPVDLCLLVDDGER